jgi:hypothetical protein
MAVLNPDELPDPNRIAETLGPGAIDRQLRQTIGFCWLMLPPSRRSVDELEAEVRRLVDRAFRDIREDEKSGASGTPGKKGRRQK